MHEIDKTKLSDQTKFRLYEIKKIDNYFIKEINQQKSYSKKLSKYVTIFDYIDQILIILSATTRGISIISFTTAIGAPVGITSASFTLIFSLATGIIKKLLNTTRNKKKRHDEILMLAESKFNSTETLLSQALIDLDVSHKEFIRILNEKDKYEQMKHNLIGENEDGKQKNYKIKQYMIKKKINATKNLFFIFSFFLYIKMLEITMLVNNSQYFWINLKILKLKQNVNSLISLINMVISQL